MILSERLRQLRELKNLTQGDIEGKTGLKRCYVSRVEHGHTVPSVETLEKFAAALEVPIYRLFYDGDNPARRHFADSENDQSRLWGSKGEDARLLKQFSKMLGKISQRDRKVLIHTAYKMAKG